MHCLLTLLLLSPVPVQQQLVRIEVRSAADPIEGATISASGSSSTTDAHGVATITLPAGRHDLSVTKDGYVTAILAVVVSGAASQVVHVDLRPESTHEEEVTVVASTRTGRRLEDQPARVEVLNREEIEEKMLMTPGDIVMMLNEMGGLRVQATSPSLGAASVRIQGMRGRYTRMLSDGLPLFGQQPGGLGLLQIPPMDLGQVEVIKGVASALYGAGAMGGVVNLLSRRPGEAFAAEALLNRSTRGATDGVLWLESPLAGEWGLTLLGSAHSQSRTDVDDDGWADLPEYRRGVVRPRLIWDDGAGRSLFVTAGATWEDRAGGTVSGAVLPATGLPYREALTTRRFDAGVVAQTLVAERFVVSVRGAFARQTHRHEFGEQTERDRHVTTFAEATVRSAAGAHTWVVGVALEDDRYRPDDLPQFAYTFTTPGLFVQDDIDVRPWLTVSASARVDRHSEYGWFVSPRGSALLRGGGWTARASAGTGFFASTPLTEETEAAGLSRLTIDGPLQAERGRGVTFDLTREIGPVSITGTFFASGIRQPIHVDRETFTLRTLESPVSNVGGEILGLVRREPFVLTGTYTYVRSRERADGDVAADVPLTPRHSAGVVAMIESADAGRVGVEVYVTGRQRLEANPYRSTSAPYVVLGVLAERRIGPVRFFVNGENLTDVRQSHWDPLLLSERAADGRWTVDGWAPLEGRVVNGGVRVLF